MLAFADVELDERSHQVFEAGEEVALSPMEFDLLRYYMLKPGVVLSKVAIGAQLWPHHGTGVTPRRDLRVSPAPQDRHR